MNEWGGKGGNAIIRLTRSNQHQEELMARWYFEKVVKSKMMDQLWINIAQIER